MCLLPHHTPDSVKCTAWACILTHFGSWWTYTNGVLCLHTKQSQEFSKKNQSSIFFLHWCSPPLSILNRIHLPCSLPASGHKARNCGTGRKAKPAPPQKTTTKKHTAEDELTMPAQPADSLHVQVVSIPVSSTYIPHYPFHGFSLYLPWFPVCRC